MGWVSSGPIILKAEEFLGGKQTKKTNESRDLDKSLGQVWGGGHFSFGGWLEYDKKKGNWRSLRGWGGDTSSTTIMASCSFSQALLPGVSPDCF